MIISQPPGNRGIGQVATIAIVLFLIFCAFPSLAQCPLCKNTLTNSEEGRSMAENINMAVLVLLPAPFVIFGLIAYAIRRGHAAQSGDKASEPTGR